MSEGTFIRGLWGDDQVAKHAKSIADAARCVLGRKHPGGTTTYVYGQENADVLWYLGVPKFCEPVGYDGHQHLLKPEAVDHFGSLAERDPARLRKDKWRGLENYGISIWRHKLEIIHHAMVTTGGPVVWLDWDCWMLKPLPADFWLRLAERAVLQTSLLALKPGKFPWRLDDPAISYMPHGAWIYCRELWVIERLLELSREQPSYTDEILIVYWLEKDWGGWYLDRWVRDKHEPPNGYYSNVRQAFHCYDGLFREGAGTK